MAAVTVCIDFGAPQKWDLTPFPHLSHLFAMNWQDWMSWSTFFECWVLSQLFHSPLSISSSSSLVPLYFLPLKCYLNSVQFSSVQSISRVRLFMTPWIAARQASLFIIISRSSLRLTSIESVMPSSHLILCHLLLLLPPIPPSIRVFSNESTLRMRWPKHWSFGHLN